MDMTSNNINQNQINQNNSYNNTGINNVASNYQGTAINNNYMNGGKNIPQQNNNIIQPNPPQYTPQNNNQTYCGNYNMPVQNIQQPSIQSDIQNQNEKEFTLKEEFILLDGSTPNKKRKYVFVGEIDITQPVFSLEDIRKIVSDEFDKRFGEEEK